MELPPYLIFTFMANFCIYLPYTRTSRAREMSQRKLFFEFGTFHNQMTGTLDFDIDRFKKKSYFPTKSR